MEAVRNDRAFLIVLASIWFETTDQLEQRGKDHQRRKTLRDLIDVMHGGDTRILNTPSQCDPTSFSQSRSSKLPHVFTSHVIHDDISLEKFRQQVSAMGSSSERVVRTT